MAIVLIVDDEESFRSALAALLSDIGYEVRVASNGGQALEMVDKEVPDLVISDIQMPVVGGPELCRRLKDAPATAGVPVILMSGHTASIADRGGADAWVNKPFEPVEIEALITACLSQGL